MCAFALFLVAALVRTGEGATGTAWQGQRSTSVHHLAAQPAWKEFGSQFVQQMMKFTTGGAAPTGTTTLQSVKYSELAANLRMEPEYAIKVSAYFSHLDTDKDGKLSEFEFIQAAKYEQRLQNRPGRQIFDLFAGADRAMTEQEFFRFVAICTEPPAGPSKFAFTKEDLKGIPVADTVGGDQDRGAMMQLFAMWDENTSGGVDKAEFDQVWWAPELWKLREEGIVSSYWMYTESEFECGKAKVTSALSLPEFATMLEDCRKHRDQFREKGPKYEGPFKAFRGSTESQRYGLILFVSILFAAMQA